MKINRHFLDLQGSYLFSEIGKRVTAHAAAHPDQGILRMGIGDVTLPMAPAVVAAMQAAAGELGVRETFRGYGPEQGYDFLRQAVAAYYGERGVALAEDEIFISDGAKSDIGNILDLFAADNTVLIPDPVYPVYVDTNVMAGRTITYLQGTRENGFLPLPEAATRADIIYLCSPNNPTGATYRREQLQTWVDFARQQGAVILYDAAYEAFVSDPDLPTSIFQIPGAETCAIEFCSLSKTAGFTGTRCGYTVVPHALSVDGTQLNRLWLRRQTTKFNGVPYIVQRGAEAALSPAGRSQTAEAIRYYMANARTIVDTLHALGIWCCGGDHSPYIWLQCPDGFDSWGFFDHLLTTAGVVGTPGAGFGPGGEGFFRLTAFGKAEDVAEATERLRGVFAS